MDDNLTDEQRAAQVRGWLGNNFWYLLAGVVLGLGMLFGWRQWTSYSDARAEKASALYDELLTAVRVERTARAEEIATELARDYPGTPYRDQARLAVARMKLDRSLPDEAAHYLEQVVKESSSPGIVNIARLRLARVLIQQEKYEDALKLLGSLTDSAFEARYHEVRGDAYFAMGRADEARAEYEAALKGAGDGSMDPGFVQAKLDEIGHATPAADPAPAAGGQLASHDDCPAQLCPRDPCLCRLPARAAAGSTAMKRKSARRPNWWISSRPCAFARPGAPALAGATTFCDWR